MARKSVWDIGLFAAVLLSILFLHTASSAAAVQESAPLEPSLVRYAKGLPLESGGIFLTKYHVNGKMFYYAQFVDGADNVGLSDAQVRTSSSRTRLAIMLGWVADGNEDFVLPEVLYVGCSGYLYGRRIRLGELNHRFTDFEAAIRIAGERLDSRIRAKLADIAQWLDAPTKCIPVLGTEEITALYELHELRQRLFVDGLADAELLIPF